MKAIVTAVLGCILALAAVNGAQAQIYTGTFSMDTSSLQATGNNFWLDFQLITDPANGSSPSVTWDNTVTATDFNFGGGSLIEPPSYNGSGSGDASSTITMDDAASFNEVYEQFTPGSTLSFTFTTTNVASLTLIPDEFSFGILDNTFSNIPTTDPGGTLMTVDLGEPGGPSTNTFASDPTQYLYTFGAPVVNVTGSPEAGSGVGFAICLVCGLLILALRRPRALVAA